MKTVLSFESISSALHDVPLPDVDLVVGVARGGIVPACLLAYRLRCPMVAFPINFRDDENRPRHESPSVGSTPALPPDVRSILLVDDVSVTGATLEAARTALAAYRVTTLVLKGKADIVVFPEISTCVNWPWNTRLPTNGRATREQTSDLHLR